MKKYDILGGQNILTLILIFRVRTPTSMIYAPDKKGTVGPCLALY